jgi:DNA-binding HxlR family transcriptional regulator
VPRSYGQYDPLAWALDLVGERWTLLILRELLLGPRRFSDLLDRLPGLSKTLLSTRLRKLEAERLVRRERAASDSRRYVYAPTEDAWSLAIAFARLGIWGAHRMGPRQPHEVFRPSSFALGMAVFADRDAARGVHETYEFDVEGERFHLRVDNGTIEPREGPAPVADLVVRTDASTCVRIMRGESPAALLEEGAMTAEGSPQAGANCLAIFRPPPDAAALGIRS